MSSVADIGTTLAGGGAGMALLATVQWTAVPYGECVKIGVAMALVCLSYVMYHGGPKGQ